MELVIGLTIWVIVVALVGYGLYKCDRARINAEKETWRSYRRVVKSVHEIEQTIDEMNVILMQMAEERRKIERVCTMPIEMTEITKEA